MSRQVVANRLIADLNTSSTQLTADIFIFIQMGWGFIQPYILQPFSQLQNVISNLSWLCILESGVFVHVQTCMFSVE